MRIQNNWNFNTSLAEMQNGTVTLENGLAVSNKVKHILTIKPCNWEFTLEKWKFMFKQKTTQIFTVLFGDSQKLKTTQIFSTEWLKTVMHRLVQK